MNLDKICISCMEDDSGSPICPKCGQPFNPPVNNLLLLPPRTMLREQYLIGRALGHGGFGITYLAWDAGLQTRLAMKEYMPAGVAGRIDGIKVVPLSDSTKPEYEWGLERFLEEARTLKKSNHPNIVSVDTIFRDNGTAYLVMEYLEGINFAEFLNRRGGTIPFADALRVISPVMDALIAVHALGVIHRDVSPDNIFIAKSGKVKLIDFGAARNALSQKSRNLSTILKGGYAPEEQYRSNGQQGAWTDVYATGATVYRAITGKVPAPSLDRQADDTLERPSKLGIAIPAAAEAALMKAMSVRSEDRFQTMDEFKRALTGGATAKPAPVAIPAEQPAAAVTQPSGLEAKIRKYETPPPAAEARPPLKPAPAPRKSPKWMVPAIVGVIFVLIAAAVAVMLSKRSQKPTSAAGTAEWPAQPSGIPQPDQERQQQLEAGGQQVPNLPGLAPQEVAENQPAKPTPVPPVGPAKGQKPAAPETQPAQPQTTPAPERAPAPIAPPSAPTLSYNEMLDQSGDLLNNKQYTEAQAVLNKAIRANPADYRAYNTIAIVELYYLNQPSAAFEHYRAALAKGGIAAFHVLYEKSDGWLRISHGNAGFKSSNAAESFDPTAVVEAKKNKTDFFKPGAKARNTFHVKLSNGKNYNFEPGSKSATEEVNFIISVIGS